MTKAKPYAPKIVLSCVPILSYKVVNPTFSDLKHKKPKVKATV